MVFVLGLVDILLGFVDRIYRMTIHLNDNVTLSNTGLMCRASRLDTDDNDALIGLETELVLNLGAQIVQLKTPLSLGRLGPFL